MLHDAGDSTLLVPKSRVYGAALYIAHRGPRIGMMTPRIAVVIACVVAVPAVAAAQSLADLAKAEQARRESIATPAKVITNESLRPEPAPTVSPLLSAPSADSDDQEPASSASAPAATNSARRTSTRRPRHKPRHPGTRLPGDSASRLNAPHSRARANLCGGTADPCQCARGGFRGARRSPAAKCHQR